MIDVNDSGRQVLLAALVLVALGATVWLLVAFILPKWRWYRRLTPGYTWVCITRVTRKMYVPDAKRLESDHFHYYEKDRVVARNHKARRLSSHEWWRNYLRGHWYIVKRNERDLYLRKEQIREGEAYKGIYVANVRPRRFRWQWKIGPGISLKLSR